MNINYPEIIHRLNHTQVWVLQPIELEINSAQFIALLKAYQPHWEMRFGILYDSRDDYFYVYRSGFVVGKYRFVEQADNRYHCSEMYGNRFQNYCMVIFEVVQEACRQHQVPIDRREIEEHVVKTRKLIEADSLKRDEVNVGPQSKSDNDFTAKARRKQSEWRAMMGFEMGTGPSATSKSYYGNMLRDGRETGANFLLPETFEYAQWRISKRIKGETIDAFRLFNNLLSSMPMAFNLFHPLMLLHAQHPEVVDKMIKAAFPDIKEIFRVIEIGIEFIPLPVERYTGDKSAMDAFVRFQDKQGNEYLIAIETKYTDTLGNNTASDKEVYANQLNILKETALFTEQGIELLATNQIPLTQIYRNFLLAEVYGRKQGYHKVYSGLVAPGDHPSTDSEVESLKRYLRSEVQDRLVAVTLEDFTQALVENCPVDWLPWIDGFRQRYFFRIPSMSSIN